MQLIAECMRDRDDGSFSGADGDVKNVLQLLEFEAAALHSASQEAFVKGADGCDAMQWVRDRRLTCCGLGNAQHVHSHSHNSNGHHSNSDSIDMSGGDWMRLSYNSGGEADVIRGPSRVTFHPQRDHNGDQRISPNRSASRERDIGYSDRHSRLRPESTSTSRSASASGSGLRQSTERLPSRERDISNTDRHSRPESASRSRSGSGRRIDSPSAPSPTDNTDDIQARYLALLRQMKSQGRADSKSGQHRPVAGSVAATAQRRQQGRKTTISPSASMGASVSGSRRGSQGVTSVNMLTDQDRRGSININTNTSTSPSPTDRGRSRTGASIGIDIDRASSILICQHIH